MAHYCSKHGVPFFKKGKMKRYAHPIKDADGNDTGEWCNEPEEQTKEQEKPFAYSPEKSASIERQKSADIAFNSRDEGEYIEATLKRAERIYQWIHNPPSMQDVQLEDAQAVKSTATAVNPTPKSALSSKDEAIITSVVEEESKPTYATQTQLEQLTALHKQYPGEIEKLKVKYGFQKKLTKANADKLIAELIVVKEAKSD